ncbi:unnamed protein product [Rotaria magnacalcarata]|uniref:VCBS repeat-containing protein n=2 Tax=Rotaria magnacalcarata TaxID=392030 RepID=A0A816WCI5_9BILA|nr:unnamed protein product [Rotaria magnacalcarata]CAF2131398.1 unnamed protein product [Rotaria magnacalcarata]CAF2133779.1 unnamed protein product [Rotaria magnacalcarata]CAF3957911.1 unnamed protein product [Rotaria magnacalcarata]CAF4124546.1 unnamed protein product [Rotaria magnacalcarata]
MNNDTILDIAASNYGDAKSDIGILYGLGNGTFLAPKLYSTGSNVIVTSIAIADFDNDGRNDVVATNANKNTICILLRDKTEPFGEQVTFSSGNNSNPYAVVVSDFNNDNKLDIAVANSQANNIGIFLGYGNGSFANQYKYDTGARSIPIAIATGDFNNDKQVDTVVANSNKNTICIFLGYGNGNFTLLKCYSTGLGSEPSFIFVGDLNKNNQTDLVVTNKGINNLLVLYGVGNGTFATPILYSLGYDSSHVSAAIGDFNDDSWLDIVVTNDDWNYIEVLLQTC